MEESCVLFPNVTVEGKEVLDANGEPIRSQLWDELVDLCSRTGESEEQALTQAVSLWKLAHYKPFLDEHSGDLRYSTINDGNGNLSRGEVTFTSLMKVISGVVEDVVEQTPEGAGDVIHPISPALAEAFLEKVVDDINKEIVPNKNNPPSIAQQRRRAISKLEELANNNLEAIGDNYFSIRYVRSKGRKVGVEVYLTKDSSSLERFIRHGSLLTQLQGFLNDKGLDYWFLREEESNAYTDDEEGSRKAYEHLQGVISVVTDENQQEQMTYRKAAQVLSYMLKDTPLYRRILDNLTREQFADILQKLNPEMDRSAAETLYTTSAFDGYRPVMEEILFEALSKQSTRSSSIGQAVALRLRNFIHHLPFSKEDTRALKKQKDRVEQSARDIVKKIRKNRFSEDEEMQMYINKSDIPTDIYSKESPFGSTAALSDPYRVQAQIALNTLQEIGEDLGKLRRSDLNRFLRAYKNIERPMTKAMKGLNQDISVTIIQEVCQVLASEYDKMVNDLSKLNFDKDDVTSKNATTLYQAALFINKIKELRATLTSTIEFLSPEGKNDSPEDNGFISRLKEAAKQLDYFTNSEGGNQSIEKAIESKTIQWVAKFCEDIYGKPYVERACGIIWQGGKLVRSKSKRRFFGKEDAIAYRNAYQELSKFIDISFSTTEEQDAALQELSSLAQQLYKEELEDIPDYLRSEFIAERLAASTEEQNTALTEILTENVGWLSSMMYSMMYSGDIMNQFKDYAVKQQKAEANILTAKEIQEINGLMLELKKIDQNFLRRGFNISDATTRKFAEVDKDGVRTGYFVTPYNLGKWHQDFEDAKRGWIDQFYKQNPQYRAMPNDNPTKRLALDSYINRQKRLWHRTHSHWDENLQQYLPGIKVKTVGPSTPNPTDIFYTGVEDNAELADYNNTDADFNAIEKADAEFRNTSNQANRTSGYYENRHGNKYVRFHRLQEVDDKGNRIPSSVEAKKTSEEDWLRASELGSRTDAFLRVVFETKGADFDAAVRAANTEQVELLKDMQPKLFDTNNSEDKAYLDKVYKDAVSLMRSWASKGIKWKTTNLIVNTGIGGLKIAGEMDVLLKYPDGTFEVWDMKTTDKTKSNEFAPELNVNYEAQLNFYAKALRDAGYTARVGGIIKIDSLEGGISLAARSDRKLSDLKLQPFNLKDRGQKRLSLQEAIEAQAAVEGEDVKDNSTFGTEESTIYDELAEAKDWQVIAYVEKYHPEYAQAVKAFFENSVNQSPMSVLRRFGIQPKSASDILNMIKASDEASQNTTSTINYLDYKSDQWEKLSAAEKSWMMKVLDLKTRMDSKYPSVPYGLMPQFQARAIEKVRAMSGSKSDLLGGLNPVAWVKTMRRGIMNSLVATADDYEFGDASTFNGDELTSLSSMKGLSRDRLQRMPIIGVNNFIHSYDVRKQRDLEAVIANDKTTEKDRQKAREKLIKIRIDASKECTTEIFHSLAAYSVMTNNYVCLKSIVDAMEVVEGVMHSRKDMSGNSLEDPKTISKRMKSQQRAMQQSRVYLNKELYNVHTKRLAIGPIVLNKLINVWGAVTSFTTIAGNLMAGMTNKKVGKSLTFDESVIGEHYTLKEWSEAEALWLHHMWTKAWLSPVSDSGRLHFAVGDDLKQDKLSLFLRWSDSQRKVRDTYMKYNPQKSKFRKLNPLSANTFYMPFELGDAYMQGMSSLACALHTKLYDTTTGKEISLWDALVHDTSKVKKTGMGELVIKEGVIKRKEDAELYKSILTDITKEREEIAKEEANMATSGLSMATKMLAKERISVRRNHIKELEDKLEDITWQDSDTNNFSIYVGNVNVGLHGVYNSIDRAQFQYNLYGKMVSMMRGYALGNMHRVFGTYNIQLSLKDMYGNPKAFEGEMSAMFKALAYVALGAQDETPMLDSKSFNFMERFWAVMIPVNRKQKMMKQGFSSEQVYAVKRFNTHMWHLFLRWIWLGMLNRWIKQLLAHLKSRDDLDKKKTDEEEFEEMTDYNELEFELDLDDADISKEEKAKLQWDYKQFLSNLYATDLELNLYRFLGTYTAVETRTQWESMAFLTPKGLLTEIPQVFDANPLSFSMFFRLLGVGGELVNKDVYSKNPSASLEINRAYHAGDSKGIIHSLKLMPWLRFPFSWMDPDSYTKSYLFYRMVNAGLRQSKDATIFDKLNDALTSWSAMPSWIIPEPEDNTPVDYEEDESAL